MCKQRIQIPNTGIKVSMRKRIKMKYFTISLEIIGLCIEVDSEYGKIMNDSFTEEKA
jgi:hypothetical protein